MAIELRLYDELLETDGRARSGYPGYGAAVGEVDALGSVAGERAASERYVRPVLIDEMEISIEDGRHPVIESISTERFIPNNTNVESRRERHPDHHRPEHGRQVDVSAAGGADRPAQPDRQLRARCRSCASASSTASSPASARPTNSPAASRHSWWRCTRPRTSSTTPRTAR